MTFTVAGADDRTRLDQFLAKHANCSRAEARRLIEDGAVRVDGRRAQKGTLLSAGARVDLERAPPSDDDKRPIPEPTLPLSVLYVDEALVALDKPPGMPTHPLRAGERGTLASALVARYPECATVADDPREGGAAHRLDIDTSGVLVAGRTREAWLALRHAFSTGQVRKIYWALVSGRPPDAGEIDAPLAHATARKVRALDDEWSDSDARPALTRYQVLARADDFALIAAEAATGRMHQIRAHLAHAGFPLVGDPLYGGPPPFADAPGHFLHAERLTLPHPTTRVPLTVAAPLPPARARLLSSLLGFVAPH